MKRLSVSNLTITKRPRLSYANVMSTIAVFLALGGVGYAAAMYTGANIIDGTLTGADVQDRSLSKTDIGYNAVGTYELESNSVIGGHVIDGALTGADIGDGSLQSQDVASTFKAPDSGKLGGMDSTLFLHNRQVVQATAPSLPPRGNNQYAASCPAGKRVISGGFFGDPSLTLRGSFPLQNSWWIAMTNNSYTTAMSFTVYAVCA